MYQAKQWVLEKSVGSDKKQIHDGEFQVQKQLVPKYKFV